MFQIMKMHDFHSSDPSTVFPWLTLVLLPSIYLPCTNITLLIYMSLFSVHTLHTFFLPSHAAFHLS